MFGYASLFVFLYVLCTSIPISAVPNVCSSCVVYQCFILCCALISLIPVWYFISYFFSRINFAFLFLFSVLFLSVYSFAQKPVLKWSEEEDEKPKVETLTVKPEETKITMKGVKREMESNEEEMQKTKPVKRIKKEEAKDKMQTSKGIKCF